MTEKPEEIAGRLGLDLDEQEITDLSEDKADWKDGNHDAFVSLSQFR